MAKNEFAELTLDQTISKLKKDFNDRGVELSDEFEWNDYVDFMLSHKGLYVLCKMNKEYPYRPRFRLVWTPNYMSVWISKLVDSVCEVLFLEFYS